MQLVLVPHSVTQTTANLWLCASETDVPPGDFPLTLQDVPPVTVSQASWRVVTADGELPAEERKTWVQVVHCDGLDPGTSYVATAEGAMARFSTLPTSLPRPNETPFTVLLGSCYAAHNDHGVGPMMDIIGQNLRPSIKFLCGDQVYLDQQGFLPGIPFTAKGMARGFLAKYLRNWTGTSGLGKVLREGATWFSPDDHEYWNNFPNPATAHPATLFEGRRKTITRIARSLCRDFQIDDPALDGAHRTFKVGILEFFVADTRTNRESGNHKFQADVDQQALIDWVEALQGPGVLVVGQPIFDQPASALGAMFADRTLPNYEDQYPPLVRSLLSARHSVLVLTGDVHYGRVASTMRLSGNPEIFEVIASPAAVVFGPPENTSAAPEMFPAKSSGGAQVPARTFPESERAGDNFATLGFTEASGIVRVTVRLWYVREPAREPTPIRFSLT